MRNWLKWFSPLALFTVYCSLITVLGCSSPYAPAPQILPAHIRKIAVRPFANNTTQYGLEEKLTLRVINEFVHDGRLQIVNKEEDADGVLGADINRYILQPLTYDKNLVTQQYKMWVLLNVYFIDRVGNVTLWTEPNMEGLQIYYDVTQPGGITEEEARGMLWDKLSTDIVKRTVEGFGSVSTPSDNKVPK